MESSSKTIKGAWTKGKEMNQTEFLKELAKTKKKFKWETILGNIRGSRYSTKLKCIISYCPIEAVGKNKKVKDAELDLASDLGRKLKLKELIIYNIMSASDFMSASDSRGRNDSNDRLRKKILKVLGLEEKCQK